jgi:general secretion pathway protein K
MRPDRRGVALMIVLWLIVVVGVVATAIAAASRSDTTVALNQRARATARYAAESGILVATDRIQHWIETNASQAEAARIFQDIDRHFVTLREVALGDGRFGIAVVDLNARIDVNRSSGDILRAFFAQFAGNARADAIVAGLEDWKDADDQARPGGAEWSEYAAAGSPYVPRNAPLDRLDDLAHVLNVGDSLAALVAPYVTVNGDGLVNVNSAAAPVLAALPGMSEARARDIVARRSAGETFTSPTALQDLGPAYGQLAITPTRLLIVSRGWLQGHALTHEIQAVYGIAGAYLYLMSWRERDL